MENLTLTFLGISSLFLLFLVIKQFLNKKNKERFCVICAAVVLTWLFLLFLFYFRLWMDQLIIALLMGETILAAYYILEKKENLKLFRLPILLSLVWAGYSLISKKVILESAILVLFIWAILGGIFLFQKNKKSPLLSNCAEKMLACCREA